MVFCFLRNVAGDGEQSLLFCDKLLHSPGPATNNARPLTVVRLWRHHKLAGMILCAKFYH